MRVGLIFPHVEAVELRVANKKSRNPFKTILFNLRERKFINQQKVLVPELY